MTLSLAVLPGVDDVLTIGSISMQERLGVDITASLKDEIVRGTKGSSMSTPMRWRKWRLPQGKRRQPREGRLSWARGG